MGESSMTQTTLSHSLQVIHQIHQNLLCQSQCPPLHLLMCHVRVTMASLPVRATKRNLGLAREWNSVLWIVDITLVQWMFLMGLQTRLNVLGFSQPRSVGYLARLTLIVQLEECAICSSELVLTQPTALSWCELFRPLFWAPVHSAQ